MFFCFVVGGGKTRVFGVLFLLLVFFGKSQVVFFLFFCVVREVFPLGLERFFGGIERSSSFFVCLWRLLRVFRRENESGFLGFGYV